MPTDQQLANAVSILAVDAVEQAKSGHPGMPMGMALIATKLWRHFLRFNPKNPRWPNRDRFILSNGHGAMLQYALLHLTGFDLSIDDIKHFRQLHSKTPGHPEYGDTPGVEATTGPLGQGLAMAVGMALAEQLLSAQFNRPGFPLIDHHTYVFAGDGDLMEGISHEACSLAGTWGLGKLIVFYDDNGISIDGDVSGWFTDDTAKRFQAYGWHVIDYVDGHDGDAIHAAIVASHKATKQPSLICCKTRIGYGSPNKAGTASAHGAPLGESEVQAVRQQLDWPHEPFHIPQDIKQAWNMQTQGTELEKIWNRLFSQYESHYKTLASELLRRLQGWLPQQWPVQMTQWIKKWRHHQPLATRKASQQCLQHIAPQLPELIGGSADLTESNGTLWSGARLLNDHKTDGNYIEYGVREFAMSAIMNGLALYGGFIPFAGTFLTFSDYARNAVRLSALMRQRVIYIYTHDSIGLGEDGPTHQPIEHIAMLRATPNIDVWRPADNVETAVAWQQALSRRDGPTALLLTRQNVMQHQHSEKQLEVISCGGYVVFDHADTEVNDGIFIATGSEVSLAVAAAQLLAKEGAKIRVVSMPCVELFKRQSIEYREKLLPAQVTQRVAIEAGSPDSWYQFVGLQGKVIGIEQFGLSAPANDVFKALGFTVDNVAQVMRSLLRAKVNM